ncbi:hypothetical protein LY85_0563 [Clostridium sp. KNHs216]|nr:hypothetical protein LY85_0563 [Clostridium sp. KNHs216]
MNKKCHILLFVKHICEPAVFILLTIVNLFVLKAMDQDRVFYFHPYRVIIVHIIILFLFGMFLNSINKKLVFRFALFYLAVSLLCIVAIILLYVFYASLPQFFVQNLNTIQLFLSVYSGANFLSAFYGEKSELGT